MSTDLPALIAALEAATGPDPELDERLAVEVFGWVWNERGFWSSGRYQSDAFDAPTPLTASLEATADAIEARWPGAAWEIDPTKMAWVTTLQRTGGYGRGATQTLALCLAAARLAASEVR